MRYSISQGSGTSDVIIGSEKGFTWCQHKAITPAGPC